MRSTFSYLTVQETRQEEEEQVVEDYAGEGASDRPLAKNGTCAKGV